MTRKPRSRSVNAELTCDRRESGSPTGWRYQWTENIRHERPSSHRSSILPPCSKTRKNGQPANPCRKSIHWRKIPSIDSGFSPIALASFEESPIHLSRIQASLPLNYFRPTSLPILRNEKPLSTCRNPFPYFKTNFQKRQLLRYPFELPLSTRRRHNPSS